MSLHLQNQRVSREDGWADHEAPAGLSRSPGEKREFQALVSAPLGTAFQLLAGKDFQPVSGSRAQGWAQQVPINGGGGVGSPASNQSQVPGVRHRLPRGERVGSGT